MHDSPESMKAIATIHFKPDTEARVLWHVRPTCGEDGCSRHPQCVCSLCGKAIGMPEDDPRWQTHDKDCDDCDICRDRVPVMIFRGEGRSMKRAQFHISCIAEIADLR